MNQEEEFSTPEPKSLEGQQFFLKMQRAWLSRANGPKAMQQRMNRLIRVEGELRVAKEARITAESYEQLCEEKVEVMRFFVARTDSHPPKS